jgi:hypothetical protein
MEKQARCVSLRRAICACALVVLFAGFVPCSLGEGPQARKQPARPNAAARPKVPCTSAEDVRDLPGTWASQFEPDVETSTFLSKPDLARALKDMTVYAELVHAALRIDGYTAQWYRSVGGRLFGNGPAQYQMNVELTDFDCHNGFVMRRDDPDRIEQDWGSTASAAILVNSTWSMSGPEAHSIINGKKYYSFGSPVGDVRGFPAYQTEGSGTTTWTVLVSKPGKKPFHFATRKELLESMRAQAEAERAADFRQIDAAMKVRSPEEQKIDHDKELALFLKGAKDDAQREHWRQRFEHDYRTDQQKLEELHKKMNKDSDKAVAHLDQLIAQQTPEQMSMPAMAHPSDLGRVWPDFQFLQTHEERCGKGACGGGAFGSPFAIPNRNYYNAELSPGRPQFFCVVFEWQGRTDKIDPRLEKMRDDFFAKFDFDKLVSMLE